MEGLMKKALLAAAACFVPVWGAAIAADMPVKAPVMAPPVLSWTGFYIGANAGFDKSTGDASNPFIALTGTDTGTGGIGRGLFLPPSQFNVNSSRVGAEGGLQLGYNWEAAPWVFGIVADFDGSSASETQVLIGTNPAILPETVTVGSKLQALGTARVRIGWAASGTSMVYLTGGLAYGEHQLSLAAVGPTWNPPLNVAATTTVWDPGWVVGGGWEGKWGSSGWSVVGELLYVQLRSLSVTLPYAYVVGQTSTLTATLHENDFVARAGLNYHFGSPTY
jgi:outer membrane immunogenic protein